MLVSLQKAIYQSLSQIAPVVEVKTKTQAFPFIEIGELQILDNHTKTNSERYDVFVQIHVFTKGNSSLQSKQFNKEAMSKMKNLQLTGQFKIDFITLELNRTLKEQESDANVFHNVQEYKITIEEEF